MDNKVAADNRVAAAEIVDKVVGECSIAGCQHQVEIVDKAVEDYSIADFHYQVGTVVTWVSILSEKI